MTAGVSAESRILGGLWGAAVGDARRKIEAWRAEYNSKRPQSSLGYRSPGKFIESLGDNQRSAADFGC